MAEYSSSNAPTFADVPTFANVYLYPNVPYLPHFYKGVFVPQCTPLTPPLQMYICTLIYPIYPTFTNVYLYANVPHLPPICKCIFIPHLPQSPHIKVLASTKQTTFLLLQRI